MPRFGVLAGDSGALFPHEHGSMLPLHGSQVPRAEESPSSTEHTLPICLIATSMDLAVVPGLTPAQPFLPRMWAAGRLQDQNAVGGGYRDPHPLLTLRLRRFRFKALGEKFYIDDDYPKKSCNPVDSFKACCVLTKHISSGTKLLWRRVWRGEKWVSEW